MPNYCIKCGIKLQPEWNVCPECGTNFKRAAQARIPSKALPYTLPKEIKLPLIIRIFSIAFAVVLVISLFLPYMIVTPYHYLYPDGNVYGYTTPFLLVGTVLTIVSTILTNTTKIKQSIVLGLVGCGFVFLTILDAIYSTTNPHPRGWICVLGIGFYVGLIAGIGLIAINIIKMVYNKVKT